MLAWLRALVDQLQKTTKGWLLLLGVGAAGIVTIAFPAVRDHLLRSAGWALVAEDPLVSDRGLVVADSIVIGADTDGAGALEAADLVHRGIAQRVAVFADPPDAVDREFVRRGVPYFNAATTTIQQLHSLGVNNVEQISRPVEGTEDEGKYLPGWCKERGYHTVVFVSTTDHSRRSRRVLERAMAGSGTRMLVHYSHYSEFDPNSWWRDRNEIRTQIMESEKLAFDLLRHPFS